jgi:hypothetical protein
MWLKKDPNFSIKVMGFLNENYVGKWIGRNRLLAWPAGSPDFNPLHFCLSVAPKMKLLLLS